MSLVWDFYREIGNDVDAKLGGVVHYYDEQAQDLFLNEGLKTRLTNPVGGSWESATLKESQFINTTNYGALSLDHPANGTLYLAAITPTGGVQYMRYQYAADISAITQQVTYSAQVDNAVTQISASVDNVDNDWFTEEASLFNPGSKLTLGIAMGGSVVYPIGVSYVDESSHDPQASSVSISGRNAIGFFLKDSKFGLTNSFTGLSNEVCDAMFALAGVPNYYTQTGGFVQPFKFDPMETILDGFTAVQEFYTSPTMQYMLKDMPNGQVLSGYADWIATLMPNGYYTFEVGKDIFQRKTKKSSDGAYKAVYVTGKDAGGEDLIPVLLEVASFQFWGTPTNKIMPITAPDGLTQSGLQLYAEAQAEQLQYIGIGEDFTGKLRPNLLVGDIAEIYKDGIGTALGIITSVKHILGKNGCTTQFSVDSGGSITGSTTILTKIKGVGGYNRKKKMSDIIKVISK